MSEFKKDIIDLLKILADQTRLEILDLLYEKNMPSSEIQSALNKSQSTISQHLKVLTDKNLINYYRFNKVKYYKIKNLEIFKLLVEIKDFVAKLNQEKLKDLRDLDVIDTLS